MPMGRKWVDGDSMYGTEQSPLSTSHQHSVLGQVWRILASHRVTAEGWCRMEKSRGGAVR